MNIIFISLPILIAVFLTIAFLGSIGSMGY